MTNIKITDEQSLMEALAPIAEAARGLGIFFDAFAVRVYKDGGTSGTHVACNHDAGPLGTSNDVWETIMSGLLRRMDGEFPTDERHPDDPEAPKPREAN